MKNINLNGVFCDIIPNADNDGVSLGNVGKKFLILNSTTEREISQMSMAVFISATETKDDSKLINVDADNVFSFKEKYELRVRLTETSTGNFKDLGRLILDPLKFCESKGYCRKVFNHTHLFVFTDIKLPEYKKDEHFVVKLLIRRLDESNPDCLTWIVQSIHPIKMQEIR